MANRFNCIRGERIIDFSRFSLFNPLLLHPFPPSREDVGKIFHAWKLFIIKLLNSCIYLYEIEINILSFSIFLER